MQGMLLLVAHAAVLRAEVTPVQKVVEMIHGMIGKGVQEKHDEEVRFAEFQQFCSGTMDEKQRLIADANAQIEQLSADIAKAESDANVLGQKLQKIQQEIDQWSQELADAKKLREGEHADYQATHQDYSESVDALDRAIAILKRQSHDRKQATALLQQVQAMARVPATARRTIASFLATDAEVAQDPLSVTAPQANAYEFQSGGVVEMLEKLKDKFQDERHQLEKEELTQKHNFEMMAEELHNSIQHAEAEADEKRKARAGLLEDAAEDKGTLATTTATRDEDSKYLQDLVQLCGKKSRDYEARQTVRSEEIEALQKAVEVLQSDAVSGHAETYLPSLVQRSFGLLRADTVKPIQKDVADFLRHEAGKFSSRVLSLMATKVQSGPFDKVKQMIKDLIVRLMEEANDEAEHKGWCDTELSTNKQTRESKAEQVDLLTAEVDKLEADLAKLQEEIQALGDGIAEIDAAVAEATKLRDAEKQKNAQTIQDASEAQLAVAQAVQVLNEFYSKAADATALVQQSPADDAPETFDAPYQGMQASNGGVVGMLEVIQSDFARLEAETKADESQAADTHQKFLDDSARDKAVKQTDLENLSKDRTDKESALTTSKKDLSSTQEELDAALAYYAKLRPSCVDAGVSYADRVQRRQEEIQSLQEALRILDGQDIAA